MHCKNIILYVRFAVYGKLFCAVWTSLFSLKRILFSSEKVSTFLIVAFVTIYSSAIQVRRTQTNAVEDLELLPLF